MKSNNYSLVQEIIKDLASSLQLIKMYSVSHPRSRDSLENLFRKLVAILKTEDAVEIGLIEGEIFYREKIFFDLGLRLKDFLKELEDRKISVVRLKQGLRLEELERFLVLLSDKSNKNSEETFASYLEREGISHIEAGKIKDGGNVKNHRIVLGQSNFLERIVASLNQYGKSLENLEQALSGFIDHKTDPQGLIQLAENITSQQYINIQFLSIISVLKKHDDYTFVHCLNVALLANLQARNLGIKGRDLSLITLGGLLHDVGKIYVSRRILNSKSMISAEEFEKIKSHTLEGAKILIERGGFEKVISLIAFQHHRHFKKGGGYPRSSFWSRPNFFSRIISIADVYDALRSRRSYKSEVLVESVYKIMEKEKARMLDPFLLDKFFSVVGVWPVGTVVRLSNGCIGIVIAQNKGFIERPKVEVYYNSDYSRLSSSYMIDLSLPENIGVNIKRSLHPEGEGKKFIREILKLPSTS